MRNAIVLLLVSIGILNGQHPQMTPERRQAILDYQLTMQRANELIPAMQAMTKYLVSIPDYQERMRKGLTTTPAEQLAKIENDPKAMAILKQNNLTAREYLIGAPALRMAILAAQGRTSTFIIASPANVAFAKEHMSELKPKLDAADGLPAK